jgi:hypothetical protein
MWHNWILYLLPNLDLVCSVHMLAFKDLSVFFFSRTLRQDVLILANNFPVPASDNLLAELSKLSQQLTVANLGFLLFEGRRA